MKSRLFSFVAMLGLLLAPVLSWADSYCPKKGETFMFYPVSPVFKQVVKGYDCFFDPDLAFDNGKTNPAADNRFKPDANGLTPYSEIEGHRFFITRAMKENADKPVSEQNFLCFIEREDGAQLLLRIPFVRKGTDNALTRAMALVLDTKNSFRKGPSSCTINIPAYPVQEYEDLIRKFSGKTLARDNGTPADETVTKLATYLNGDVATSAYAPSAELHCDSVAFANVRTYVFMQPIAYCNLKGRKVQLPVYDFRGKGDSFYGANFSIASYFRVKPAPAAPVAPAAPAAPTAPVAAPVASPAPAVTPAPAVAPAPAKQAEKPVEKPVAPVKTEEPAKPSTPAKATITTEPVQEAVKPIEQPTRPETDKERLAKLSKLYGAKNAKAIMEGKVLVGFSKDMVKEVLGEPDFINVTQNMYTTLEQWVYGHEKYLYFQKDKLKSIEDF